MLAKNTRASVATLIVALITGLVVAFWVALMPAPGQAQSGDVLRLLSIKCLDITNDEGPFDSFDEPYIRIGGAEVWSGRSDSLRMKNGDVRDLTGVSATLSGQSETVQLWEFDGGVFQGGDDGPAEFSAAYTDGDERTANLTLNGGTYEIRYVVDRPPTPTNMAPDISDQSPAPGSRTRDRTPLISAVVKDAETELTQGNITLEVDGVSKPFFTYDAATDRLTYQSGRLSRGLHTVRVEATDAQGLKGSEAWSFKVIKKQR